MYLEWKQELQKVEREILNSVGFQIYEAIDHPHQYLLYIVKLIDGDKQLAQLAWNYLNDSMRLDLELRYDSVYIAAAAIFLASRTSQFPLPEGPFPLPWWSVLNIEREPLLAIAEEILLLYNSPVPTWIDTVVRVKYLEHTLRVN